MNWFQKWFVDPLKRLFSKDNLAKAEKIAQRVLALMEYAKPYVATIKGMTALTPTPIDDIAVAVLEKYALKIGRPLKEILDTENRDEKRVAIEKVLISAVRAKLRSAAADGTIQIGDVTIAVPIDVDAKIPDAWLEAAIKNLYVLFFREQSEQASK